VLTCMTGLETPLMEGELVLASVLVEALVSA
jgi:hypothetical protein